MSITSYLKSKAERISTIEAKADRFFRDEDRKFKRYEEQKSMQQEQIRSSQPPQESKLMRFGNGLARVMNEKLEPNTTKTKSKKRSSSKGLLNKEVFSSSIRSSSIFQGSTGVSIVGSNETKEQYKPKNKSPFA